MTPIVVIRNGLWNLFSNTYNNNKDYQFYAPGVKFMLLAWSISCLQKKALAEKEPRGQNCACAEVAADTTYQNTTKRKHCKNSLHHTTPRPKKLLPNPERSHHNTKEKTGINQIVIKIKS